MRVSFLILVLASCGRANHPVLATLQSAPAPDASIVEIREAVVPTKDALPHDPAVAPDGALWFTEEKANKLGRFDPRTGAFREYTLATPDSAPHGLVVDRSGAIWFTASSKGYIGKLDPTYGAVTEYAIYDPRAKDPEAPVLASDGTLFFTVRKGNLVVKLDPRTGRSRITEMPTPNARPYGIALDRHGDPFVCEFGTNAIVRIDHITMKAEEYRLPPGARPRRLTFAADGTIYYSDYARGKVGHLDPEAGTTEEWPSPNGPKSRPFGIAATPDGAIWYTESGVRPNTLVRFDPRTKRFGVTPIPSGGGAVRNMVATPDGRLFLACSGTDRVAVVTPGK
jgi:virginiamycin B lyase